MSSPQKFDFFCLEKAFDFGAGCKLRTIFPLKPVLQNKIQTLFKKMLIPSVRNPLHPGKKHVLHFFDKRSANWPVENIPEATGCLAFPIGKSAYTKKEQKNLSQISVCI